MLLLLIICSALAVGLLLICAKRLRTDRRARGVLATRLAAQQQIERQTQLTLQAMRQAARQSLR